MYIILTPCIVFHYSLDMLDTAVQEEFASMIYDWLGANHMSIDILLIRFSRYNHQSFICAAELIAKKLLRR